MPRNSELDLGSLTIGSRCDSSINLPTYPQPTGCVTLSVTLVGVSKTVPIVKPSDTKWLYSAVRHHPITSRAMLRAWSGITGWRFESSSAHQESPAQRGFLRSGDESPTGGEH